MIDLTSVPVPCDSFTIREIGEETIFLSEKGDMIHMVNEVGSFVWKALDGKHSLLDILDRLLDEYEVSRHQAEGDLISFVDELAQKGLVTIHQA